MNIFSLTLNRNYITRNVDKKSTYFQEIQLFYVIEMFSSQFL